MRGYIIGLMPEEQESLERAIVGALRSMYHAHGPITPEWFGSAAKRIAKQLANAKLDGLARVMGRRRWEGVSAEERTRIATKGGAKGGKTAWAGISKAERSKLLKARLNKRVGTIQCAVKHASGELTVSLRRLAASEARCPFCRQVGPFLDPWPGHHISVTTGIEHGAPR